MPLISKQELINRPGVVNKSYDTITRELSSVPFKKNLNGRYDIFLSHRFTDAKIIYGLKLFLEEYGYTVFVDWIEAPQADRSKVTPATAALLRGAMKVSDSLVYAASDNSSDSKWMPWELGFSDALHGRVSILPISESQVSTESYQGQEYLGLYPYVTAATIQGTSRKVLWVNQSSSVYAQFDSWKRGEPLIKRAA